jgi:hypothetical protein
MQNRSFDRRLWIAGLVLTGDSLACKLADKFYFNYENGNLESIGFWLQVAGFLCWIVAALRYYGPKSNTETQKTEKLGVP